MVDQQDEVGASKEVLAKQTELVKDEQSKVEKMMEKVAFQREELAQSEMQLGMNKQSYAKQVRLALQQGIEHSDKETVLGALRWLVTYSEDKPLAQMTLAEIREAIHLNSEAEVDALIVLGRETILMTFYYLENLGLEANREFPDTKFRTYAPDLATFKARLLHYLKIPTSTNTAAVSVAATPAHATPVQQVAATLIARAVPIPAVALTSTHHSQAVDPASTTAEAASSVATPREVHANLDGDDEELELLQRLEEVRARKRASVNRSEEVRPGKRARMG